MSVRVRFAPSPTGALHPGSARTVLFNYLFARKHGGSFILRIEDTDQSRFDPASLDSILAGIRWLGLNWDEGPEVGGDFGPYFQSERLDLYHRMVQRLIDAGHAYPCFCTPVRLEQLREEQRKAGLPTRYDRHCLALSKAEVKARIEAGETPVIRMKVPDGQTVVHDLVRGDTTFDNSTQDDQVLLKSDGFPTYHLASVVDDHEMQISHVIRGDEWLASTPKHVILYEMFGWAPPAFVHLPVVLGPDKTKLSKRHGAASVLEYRDMGYLPEAMVNFLAFLGWSPGHRRGVLHPGAAGRGVRAGEDPGQPRRLRPRQARLRQRPAHPGPPHQRIRRSPGAVRARPQRRHARSRRPAGPGADAAAN